MNAVISGRAGLALLIEGESLMSLDVDDLETLVPRSQNDLRFLLADATDLVTLENTDRDQTAERLDLEHDIACALDMTLIALDPESSMELRAEAVAALDELLANARVIERLEFTMYATPLPDSADLIGTLFCTESTATVARSFFERLDQYQTAIAAVRESWDALPDRLFGDVPSDKALFHDVACSEGLFRLLASSYGDKAKVSVFLLEALKNRTISSLRNYREVFKRWSAPLHEAAGTATQASTRQYDDDYERPTETPHHAPLRNSRPLRGPAEVVSRLANEPFTRARHPSPIALGIAPNRTISEVGRVISYLMLVLGSASALITALWQRLEAVGRGHAIATVIDMLPQWLNSPIAGLVMVIAGYGLLWFYTPPTLKKPRLIVSREPLEEQASVSARKVGVISALSGLALGALIVGILWLIPDRRQFRVTVHKGQSLTAAVKATDSKNLTITLTEIEFQADAQKYLITATSSYDGEPDLPIRRAEEGQVFIYPKEHGYKIVLLKATSDNATFVVSKNP